MECEYEMKKQPQLKDCAKAVKPNASLKTLSIFDPRFTGMPQGFPAPMGSEDIRAVRAQQLEIERMRAMAITYARHFSVR